MLHRLKLRLLYGALLDSDKTARRKKMRVILVSGFLVYLPFLILAYLVAFETRQGHLLILGFLSALTCIPVVLYAYAQGFNRPFRMLWNEKRSELLWLSLKIGFFYALILYFMILGIVEFLFGYHAIRAAMISFVASAVARDGFEIGWLRARSDNQPISIFPNGEAIGPLNTTVLIKGVMLTLLTAGTIGFFLSAVISHSRYQALMVGTFGGIATVFSPAGKILGGTSIKERIRFFLWPGLTMAVTYFLTLAYIVRITFAIPLTPSIDLAFLTALSVSWLTTELFWVAHLKRKG